MSFFFTNYKLFTNWWDPPQPYPFPSLTFPSVSHEPTTAVTLASIVKLATQAAAPQPRPAVGPLPMDLRKQVAMADAAALSHLDLDNGCGSPPQP
jgi:hypothetical protein